MNKFRWLCAITFLYAVIGIIDIMVLQLIPLFFLQLIWLFCMSMPWWNKTVKRWLKLD